MRNKAKSPKFQIKRYAQTLVINRNLSNQAQYSSISTSLQQKFHDVFNAESLPCTLEHTPQVKFRQIKQSSLYAEMRKKNETQRRGLKSNAIKICSIQNQFCNKVSQFKPTKNHSLGKCCQQCLLRNFNDKVKKSQRTPLDLSRLKGKIAGDMQGKRKEFIGTTTSSHGTQICHTPQQKKRESNSLVRIWERSSKFLFQPWEQSWTEESMI